MRPTAVAALHNAKRDPAERGHGGDGRADGRFRGKRHLKMDRDRDFRSRFIINYSVEEGGRRVRRPAIVESPTYGTLSNASKNGNKRLKSN